MSAKVYHFCQRCKQMISPSINDDRLKAYDQVADYNKYVDSVQAKRIVSKRCPKCDDPWKPKLLYIGHGSMRKNSRIRRVKNELIKPTDPRSRPGRFGFVNYKKLQQAKCAWNNTTPNYARRMNRVGLARK